MLHFLTKTFYRYATKKSSASTKSKTTCAGKRLGLKKWHLQKVIPGNIILRQKGVKWKPGQNDHTIFAFIAGRVFYNKEEFLLRGKPVRKTFVHVVREGDDPILYSRFRSNTKTWKNPCPINLKWEHIEKSPELINKGLEMMERDKRERKVLGFKRLSAFSDEKIKWCQRKLSVG